MEKHKITTLFLDIGGVLLTDGWGREQRQNAIDRFDLDTNETNDRNALLWDTYEMDKLTLEDYLNYVIFFKERPFSKEEFVDFMYQQSQPLEGALEYFKTLKKERGYKIVALSNEARDLNEHRIKKYKLNELFDFYVSSCYVRMRKPDPHMYKLAFDTAQIHPYQSVYIDDRLTYIEMARELGIPSLHYQGLQTAKDFFENC
jgi:putative hydrolase of the HAD superfamily